MYRAVPSEGRVRPLPWALSFPWIGKPCIFIKILYLVLGLANPKKGPRDIYIPLALRLLITVKKQNNVLELNLNNISIIIILIITYVLNIV